MIGLVFQIAYHARPQISSVFFSLKTRVNGVVSAAPTKPPTTDAGKLQLICVSVNWKYSVPRYRDSAVTMPIVMPHSTHVTTIALKDRNENARAASLSTC